MKISTLPLLVFLLTSAQANDDATGVSPFPGKEFVKQPSLTLEEQAVLHADFFDSYDKFMSHLFKQVNEIYTAGENGTEYDSGETPSGVRYTAFDADNVHMRIKRFCNPEFDDSQQIISVDCGVAYASEFLYAHPVYDNIYVTVYSHNLENGAAGGNGASGSRVHISQENEPASPERKLMRINIDNNNAGYVSITLDPPDLRCEFKDREPVAFSDSESEKNCGTVLREGSTLLQRLL